MTHMTLARSYLGTKENKGSADNPKIMEMYRMRSRACSASGGRCVRTRRSAPR